MKTKFPNKKTLLTQSISLLLGTSVMLPAMAQQAPDDDLVEVIEVTGLKSSLTEAASIKQNSVGVVDAISAEDIG